MALARAAKKARRSKSNTTNRKAQEEMIGKIEQLLLRSTETDSAPSPSDPPSGR